MITTRYLCKWTNLDTGEYYYQACTEVDLGTFPQELRELESKGSWQHETLIRFYEEEREDYIDALHLIASEAILDPLCLN